MNYFGRREIFTDFEEINSTNIIQVLRTAYPIHTANASDSNYLLNYEAGLQPLGRVKTYRSDIDCVCVDNVANEITEFKLGFNWGYPITLIQRGEKDSGKKSETDAIALLNECYDAENIKTKTQELARFVEITGVGYTFVDVKTTDWEDGDSYFSLDVLDPRTTFVVKSSRHIDHRPVLGVTYRRDDSGNAYFTCFTNDTRYEIINLIKITNGKSKASKNGVEQWYEATHSGEINPLGIIPITEYIRSHDRMGCFERQISELDNLNLLASDFSNSVDQNVQAIWHCNDVRFPEDEDGNIEHPQSNDWVQTFTARDGKTPFITPLSITYDYNGMLNNYVTRRALILQKCSVPQRNDNSGGSTGIAMSDATGWSAAESSACKQQGITEASKMNEVRVVLRAIKKSTNIDSGNPLLSLRAMDIKPNIKRQKSYEMTTKANTFATLVAHGINGKHALETINMFEDTQQTWLDSKDLIEAFQNKAFSEPVETVQVEEESPNADRLMQDESDQVGNSPMIDGRQTDEGAKE